jgi:branched-chain amino acid transport system substrate-binding protein
MAVVLMAALALTGCGQKEAQKTTEESDVIKIGVYEPMTGASAAGGQMTVEGIELANEMYPEVLGKKIQLVIVDNKTDKTEAANAVARLIEKDKVSVIIGSYGSSLSMSGGQVAKDAGVPVVGCSPTNPLVTLDNDYYFRVCFIDPFQGKVMAKYAYETLKAKTAAIIMDISNDYSVGLSNFFKKAFIEYTGDEKSIVAEMNYKTGDQDFTAQLTTIKELKPDVVFAPGNYGESALLIKQARELGIDSKFLGGDTWEAPEFIEIGGDAVEGVAFSTHYTEEAPVTEVSEEFLNAYKNKYGGKEANAFAALGFDAYLVARDAIERAGSADPKAIRDALSQTKDFKGATGIITLDENGDANKSAVIKKVEGGKFVFVSVVEPE